MTALCFLAESVSLVPSLEFTPERIQDYLLQLHGGVKRRNAMFALLQANGAQAFWDEQEGAYILLLGRATVRATSSAVCAV